MSEESAPTPEPASNPAAEDAPRVRRISNPRIKKPAKSAPAPIEPAPTAAVEPPATSKFPEFSDTSEEPAPRGDWPEPEAASSGTPSENQKRKRRRKKGKGNSSQQNAAPQADAEQSVSLESGEPSPAPTQPQAQQQRPQQGPPRPKLDAELLAKFAWKIYLSEVSEEGVALIGDNDAKELSRRCFRLAEIFMEEQARRR